MALIQEFLRKGGLIEDLTKTKKYSLKVKRHNEFKSLVLFKYSQKKSSFAEPMVCEARGLILDEQDNWKIVAYPYNKFFNANEKFSKPILEIFKENGFTVYEKVDGSLMTLYFYGNKWNVATSGTPDASGICHKNAQLTFANLFWQVWNELGYKLPSTEDQNKCFMFELLTPHNQVIVPQSSNRLVFHGVRNLDTLQEEKPEQYSKYNWELISVYDHETLDDALVTAYEADPKFTEGYVITSKDFHRVKAKGKEYVALTYGGNNNKTPSFLDIVMRGEQSEYIATFPDSENKINSLTRQYRNLSDGIMGKYNQWKDLSMSEIKNNIATEKIQYGRCIELLKLGKISSPDEWLKKLSKTKLKKFMRKCKFDKA